MNDEVNVSNKIFQDLIDQLLRSTEHGISSYFTEVKTDLKVKDTKALSHCYFLSMDGNGRPRTKDLAKFVALNLIDYSIPRKEIEEARKKNTDHNTELYTQELAQKARGLFTTVKNSGEGGEMLLYILVQQILKLPQLICKMPLKTNSESHYQGVDGIHVSVDKNSSGEDILCLYWGESKLYKDMDKAITNCIQSMKNYLLSDDGSGSNATRDLQLVQDNLSVENEKLENAIVQYLDKKNPLYNKVNYRGVCLIGFDYDQYPSTPNSGTTAEQIKEKIEEKLNDWVGKVSSKISEHTNLNTFDIHIFLIPFPSVKEFREEFFAELGISNHHEESSQ